MRTAVLSAGKRLDDDGLKYILRRYVSWLQGLLARLGKQSAVWQESFDTCAGGGPQTLRQSRARPHHLDPATSMKGRKLIACVFLADGPGNHGYGAPGATRAINPELAAGTLVQFWTGGRGTWYDPSSGRPIKGTVADAVAAGHLALISDGWYLSETYEWEGGYVADPSTNKSCSYPRGAAPNCTCAMEGNASDTRIHLAPLDGCYDVGASPALLGGEACLWGPGNNATNAHLARSRHPNHGQLHTHSGGVAAPAASSHAWRPHESPRAYTCAASFISAACAASVISAPACARSGGVAWRACGGRAALEQPRRQRY